MHVQPKTCRRRRHHKSESLVWRRQVRPRMCSGQHARSLVEPGHFGVGEWGKPSNIRRKNPVCLSRIASPSSNLVNSSPAIFEPLSAHLGRTAIVSD
ncbi:Hypothetical protein NTJ_05302 [Nesidiocoris tenuis]|uniref:Uncharacterized protein n=1 Tax=Nesidiocoris tenuis TaxID=355587 RepID=A0ABN7AKB2_9HEMI|nr:Hypothetical protein NTJ_05302 [Nesidiocoris tenuis]